MSEGNVRSGAVAGDLGPEDARALLDAFIDAVGLELRGRALVELHAGRRLQPCRARAPRPPRPRAPAARGGRADGRGLRQRGPPSDLAAARLETGRDLFRAAIPAIPYAPAAAFLGREKAKLNPVEGPKRVALIADAIGGVHGVSHTIERIRELGVPGYEVEVIGTDRDVDRRLPAVAEVEIPFYAGLEIGIPSLPGMVEVLAEGRFDLVHVTAPGPAGVVATLIARIMELPLLGSWHTELGAYAGMRSASPELERGDATWRSRSSTASAAACSRPAPPATSRWPGSGSSATGSDAGAAASTPRASTRPCARPDLPRRDQGPLRGPPDQGEGNRPARRLLPPRPRGRSAAAPAARRRRARGGGRCASGSATAPPSSAGWAATSCRGPTRAPTSSSSAAAPTPSARSWSRPAPAGCRWSRSPRAARPRS